MGELIYTTCQLWRREAINVIVDFENETMLTSQKTMVELFDKNINTISKHLTNIFESGELVKLDIAFNSNDSINGEIVIICHDTKKYPILIIKIP